jgi:polysaccharide biosynthesis/export protein
VLRWGKLAALAAVIVTIPAQGMAKLPDLPSGADAYVNFPPPRPDGQLPDYKIGAFDKIAVSVFQEDDLSVKDVQVDSGGNVLLPLIGQLRAAGKTATELAAAISQRLGARYLVNPQVSVIVEDSVSQKVTVQGSVVEPGVFAIQGRTTLLDAVAMAKGASRVAAMDEVIIFRDISGKRTAALFNLRKISEGQAPDPEILGNDTVVLGHSAIKAAWRDLLTASPLLSAAAYVTR